VPQPVHVAAAQIGELHLGVLAGHAQLEPGRAEQPRDEGPGDGDALDAIEARLAVRAKQNSAAHLDRLIVDAVGVHTPREIEAQHPQHDAAEHDGEGPAEMPVPVELLDQVTPVGAADEQLDEPLAQVGEQKADHGDESDATLEQRSGRVQPQPVSPAGKRRGGEMRRREGAHSPARRVSASPTRVSRSASASASVRPGMVTPVAAAAVTNFSSARPRNRATGPRLMSINCMRP
jgi:hypothetical protein